MAVNAAASGTDVPGYLTEAPAVSAFTRDEGDAFQTWIRRHDEYEYA